MSKKRFRNNRGKTEMRLRLSGEQNHRCCICHKELDPFSEDRLTKPTVEHVIPFSCGGGNQYDNLVVTCEPCNASKAANHAMGFTISNPGIMMMAERVKWKYKKRKTL